MCDVRRNARVCRCAQRSATQASGPARGKRTWNDYCEDIGVEKRTANRWLEQLTGTNDPVTAHVGQATGENEWYTPKEYIEAARTVLGNIELDPDVALILQFSAGLLGGLPT